MGNLVMLTKMSRRRTSLPSFFLALVACFYLSQPIEAIGYPGFPYLWSRSPVQGDCKDFSRADCEFHASPYAIDREVNGIIGCQHRCYQHTDEYANENGQARPSKKCRMFIYNTDTGLCKKYTSDLTDHEITCGTVGGPSMPSYDKCDKPNANPDCLNIIGLDCSYKGEYLELSIYKTRLACQQDCQSRSSCKYFVYTKDRKCKLHNSTQTEEECKYFRGPPKTKLQGCHSSRRHLLRYTSLEEGCPPKDTKKRNVAGVDDCCCGQISSSCCWSKCVLSTPPPGCLGTIKNTEWIKNELHGYWQAFQYRSALSEQSTNVKTMNDTPTAWQNLLWLSKYIQMQGKTDGNIGKFNTGKMSIFQ